MTRRVLPREEYPRLVGTELEPLIDLLPSDADVLVVEDEQGRIVGCWSAFPVVHLEGVYIAPEYRNGGSVARRLLAGMRDILRQRGAHRACTAALTDEVGGFIRRIGGRELPGVHFVVEM